MTDPILYVVATPIGNLSDMVPRAVEVLQTVSIIAAEDTRHSGKLLAHYNITTPMISYHDHSDEQRLEQIMRHLHEGKSVALISDAGTPLISDPGYRLVTDVRKAGYAVIPIPGPCAAVAALSAAGLPTDRFVFEGFLPAKSAARQKRLELLQHEERTLVFYESTHRIVETLEDMAQVFGVDRQAVIARELTKTFETIISAPLQELQAILNADAHQCKGEFVVLLKGVDERDKHALDPDAERILKILLEELSVKQASELAAKITGVSKKAFYQFALNLK